MKFISRSMATLETVSEKLSGFKHFTMALFLAALILRLGYTFIHPKMFLASDMLGYNEAAISLLQDGEFRVKGVISGSRPPVYSYFLAVMYYLFGQDLMTVRIFHAIIGAFTAVLLYKMGTLIFDKKTGVLTGIFYALYTGSWALGDMLLSETLFTLLMLLSIYFLIKAQETSSPWILFWGGIFGAAAALTRTAFFPYIPFITMCIALLKFRQPRIVSRFVFITVIFIMGILPWMLRNYYTIGVFTMNPKSGSDFYMYNHSDMMHIIYNYEDMTRFLQMNAQTWSEVKKGVESKKWAVEWIKENPHLFVIKGFRMIMNIWGFDREFLWWSFAGVYGRDPTYISLILAFITNIAFILIAPFAVAGFFISKPFKDKNLIPALVIACLHILTFIVYGFSRHRFPFVSLLIIWAAYAVVNWDTVQTVLIKGNKDWRKKAIIWGWCFLAFSWAVELLLDAGSLIGLRFTYHDFMF